MTSSDTIAAIATANGLGAICIIRISGPRALEFAKTLCDKNLKPRYATLVNLTKSDKSFIDEAIAIYFKAPFSFTGEDVVELQIHGGSVLGEIVLAELVKLGARLAQPGEFSKRAFLNGKISLDKAENIQALILAKSEGAAKILARSLRGELGDFVLALRTELVRTLAYCETAIDYADDDLPLDIFNKTQDMLEQNIKKLDEIVKISLSRKGLIDGFRVAIIGKPNVGKSSLLNALLKYERAITSDEAGTTRDSIEESLQVGSHLIKIIDTAGIREGAGDIESKGIAISKNAASQADIIMAVFDGSSLSDLADKEILKICANAKAKCFYILNKSDLDFKFDLNLNPAIKTSRNDTNELLNALNEYLNSQDTSSLMLSSTRQIQLCQKASQALKNAKSLLSSGDLELFAFELNLAITSLASISHPFERSEILDEMFLNFCLGK